MNRPRIATVLSAREWEPRLVDTARRDPTVRIVRRAYEPEDLERAAPLDTVIVGSETSWITSNRIRSIRRGGTRVVGVYPMGDVPGRELLCRGGADAALPDTTPPEELLTAATLAAADALDSDHGGRLISVTGPRGAPGRTEIAVSLARSIGQRNRTAILDLDLQAPGVAFRLGIEPGPSLFDITDALRSLDRLIATRAGCPGDLTVIGGPSPLPVEAAGRFGLADLLQSTLAAFEITIADVGPWQPSNTLLTTSDEVVLVCDAQPMNLIRAARLVQNWEGPVPRVVINRVKPGHEEETVRLARRALGLEPHTMVPEMDTRRDPGSTFPDGLLTPLVTNLLSGRKRQSDRAPGKSP